MNNEHNEQRENLQDKAEKNIAVVEQEIAQQGSDGVTDELLQKELDQMVNETLSDNGYGEKNAEERGE